jgi:hypothetical protein
MLQRGKVKYMLRYHENRMDLEQAGINSPVAFDCGAAFEAAHLAQAVFVNLDKFKSRTS